MSQTDGSGYAHSEEDSEGGNLPGGRPSGFNSRTPSSADIEYLKTIQFNTAEARSDALRWAKLDEYGGSRKLVSHHNRLSTGSDEELMMMALRAFAIWNGTHGPNQRTYSRPDATGTAGNRSRRSPGGVGHEYAFSSFRQFLSESASSNYWSTDHYYHKTHLHLGADVVTPEATDHSPPWKTLARKRGPQSEAWSSFYDYHAVTLCETYTQAGVRPRLVQFDPRPWQAWDGEPRYTHSRQPPPAPELRALPQRPRRPNRMPRDMYAKAHLVDGPKPPAPTRDPQDILREASAQGVDVNASGVTARGPNIQEKDGPTNRPVEYITDVAPLVDNSLLEQAAGLEFTQTVAAVLPWFSRSSATIECSKVK